MTDERLKQIEKRLTAATPGPWHLVAGDDAYCSSICGILGDDEKRRIEADQTPRRGDFPEDTRWVMVDPGCAPVQLIGDDNEEFIAHARQDVPDLIAEVRRLRTMLQATTSTTTTRIEHHG